MSTFASVEDARAALAERCEVIESAYEFFLAYAAQGMDSDAGSAKGTQVRDFLTKSEVALRDLASVITGYVQALAVSDCAPYDDFVEVLTRDASAARAAIRLVLVQPAISSQMVDNLNVSTHVRALLTDLFLIDEILGVRQ